MPRITEQFRLHGLQELKYMITYIVRYINVTNTCYVYYAILMYKTVQENGNNFSVNTLLIYMVMK